MDFSKVILMTDLDGTLLTDDKRILPLDLEAIERFRAGGGLFTMATGRGYSMAKHIADKLRLDCPASSGLIARLWSTTARRCTISGRRSSFGSAR